MKKLNNRGYMLVEIILAFSIAMAVMYVVMDLTIKIKNKNDDLLVRILTYTDQAVIYNMIMGNKSDLDLFDCKFYVDGNKITYKGHVNEVNKYVDEVSCIGSNRIHIGVKLLDDDFDVVIP